MLLAVLLGLLLVASVAGFVVLLRRSRVPGGAVRPVSGAGSRALGGFPGLDELVVGGDVVHDDQTWLVRGVQHVTSPDGSAWSAWHVDDRGQGGLLVTTGREDPVLFCVRAERPETVDPSLSTVLWRDHEWRRTDETGGPARVQGDRRLPRRGALAALPDADVERVVLARPDLPTRRLVAERSAGEATWNVWIGSVLPGAMFDVWPPGRGTDAERRERRRAGRRR